MKDFHKARRAEAGPQQVAPETGDSKVGPQPLPPLSSMHNLRYKNYFGK